MLFYGTTSLKKYGYGILISQVLKIGQFIIDVGEKISGFTKGKETTTMASRTYFKKP